MPYKAEWEEHGIVWMFFGDVSFTEIDKANKEFYADKRSDSCTYQIFNGLDISKISMASREVVVTAALDSGESRSISYMKVALIGDKDELLSLYKSYVETSKKINQSWHFEIFTTIEMARVWISKKPMEPGSINFKD